MHRIILGLITLVAVGGFLTLSFASRATTSAAAAAGNPIPNQYIVVLVDSADSASEARAAARTHGVVVEHTYQHALKGFSFRGSTQAAAALSRNPNVAYITADRLVQAAAPPDGGMYAPGGGKRKPTPTPAPEPDEPAPPGDDTLPTGVLRIGGPSTASAGTGVRVAVIDTGIQLNHPDLAGVTSGKTCVFRTSTANDDNGHGTHVAGTIAGRDNGIGVVGVAPGSALVGVKVLDRNGSGSWSGVICGIDWVTGTRTDNDPGNDIHVANMSLGGAGSSDTNCGSSNDDALHTAICRSTAAGVTYVVAAGNSASDASGFVPAAYPEVITVSALADFDGLPGGDGSSTCRADLDDTFADFSNFGAPVDIAAPGVCILSTWIGGGYNTISGTSMASPHVAGAAALLLESNLALSPADVRAALIAAQEPGPISGDPDFTHEGVVQLH